MLEDRLTPSAASFYWAGNGSNGYGDPANWYSSGNYDPNHLVPIGGDSVFVASGGGFTVPADYTFDWFVTSSDFTGTIELQDNTTMGSLYMGGGNLAMVGSSGSGNDLFVTQNFVFSKGNLNSSANTGTVHLQGITTAAIGTNEGTVTTGSILAVEYGTTLYYAMGTINFGNGAIIDCQVGSVVRASTPGAAQIGQGFVNINQEGPDKANEVKGVFEQDIESNMPYLVKSGRFIVNKSLPLKGHVPGDLPDEPTLKMTGGKIIVKNGITIAVEHGFVMTGGTFTTEFVAAETHQTVYIAGKMTVSGGDVELGTAPDERLSGLHVTGDVVFTVGVYHANVVGTLTSTECNVWKSEGTFTIGTLADIRPVVFNKP